MTPARLHWIVPFLFFCAAGLAVDVPTAQFDNARTLANVSEVFLTTSNVNANSFGKLFSRAVDGDIFAQPLYLEHVAFPDKTANVVYVATMHDNVYAYDADDPAASKPLWSVNLGPYDSPPGWPGGMGVLGTPLISREKGAIYVVSATWEGTQRIYRLHALDLLTGAEMFGGPVAITGQVPGSADESRNGVVPFINVQQTQRTGLAAVGNTLWIAFSSDRDHEPEHGWVFTYDATTLRQTGIYNDTPNGTRGGIWQSGRAPAVDSGGSVYFETGNGTVDDVTDFSESTIKLNSDLSGHVNLADWFTPDTWSELNDYDFDFGSTGPTLLPGTDLVVSGSKIGVFYLAHTGSLGQFQSGNNQIVQSFLGTSGCQFPLVDQGCSQIMGQAFWYTAPVPTLYVWGVHDYLRAYRFANGKFNPAPASVGTQNAFYPGGALAVSSYQGVSGTGIVWAITSDIDDGGFYFGPGWSGTGSLHAFDAMDLTKELWNSSQNASRDAFGNVSQFTSATVANGKVYVATSSDQLAVYGLLNGAVAGDVNGDSLINCADLALVTASFGTRAGQSGFDLRADLNRDGVINIRDLAKVAQRLAAGTRCP